MDSIRPDDQSWASQPTDLYEFKVCSSPYCVNDGMYVHSMEFSHRVGYTYLQNVILSCRKGWDYFMYRYIGDGFKGGFGVDTVVVLSLCIVCVSLGMVAL